MNAEPRAPGDPPAPVERFAGVELTSHPLWRLRLGQRVGRGLLYAAAITGLLASARFAIAPPAPSMPRRSRPASAQDLPAQAFALQFARAYLSWSATQPEARRDALAPFTGSALGPEAGMQPPQSGSQSVLWEQVEQARQLPHGRRIYTIAAETDDLGIVYLTVPVFQTPDGALALGGYPAFVGAPASSEALGAAWGGPEVEDKALQTVVERALRNYLQPAPSELAADLSVGAHVSLPQVHLSLEALQSLTWAEGGGAVVAVATAVGASGGRYTLAYEVDVARTAGRWEVSAIQVDPQA